MTTSNQQTERGSHLLWRLEEGFLPLEHGKSLKSRALTPRLWTILGWPGKYSSGSCGYPGNSLHAFKEVKVRWSSRRQKLWLFRTATPWSANLLRKKARFTFMLTWGVARFSFSLASGLKRCISSLGHVICLRDSVASVISCKMLPASCTTKPISSL